MEIREANPSEVETIVYTLQTSDEPNQNEDDEIIINKNTIVESREGGYEEIEVKQSSEVDKNKQIRLNEDTLFEFDCIIGDNYLTLTLNEIDALSPFYYIKKINLKELRTEVHKMFKALDTLEEVKQHIEQLFKDGKIKLRRERDEEIFFDIKAYYISQEVEFSIQAEREMTNNKDNMLLKFYQIQKKLMKENEQLKKEINK